MLLTALFPLCDVRPLLGEEVVGPFRRRATDERGEASVEPASRGAESLHFFGAATPRGRTTTGRRELTCRADNALAVVSWPLPPRPGKRGPGPFRVVARELVSTDLAVARFQLVLGTDPARRGVALGVADVARRFPSMDVEVVLRRGEKIPLWHAGDLVARAYLTATTKVADRDNVAPDWVVAADPVFFVSWGADEGLGEDGIAALHRPPDAPFALAQAALPSAGPGASMFWIRHDGGPGAARAAAEEVRRLAELCARRECLRIVATRVSLGRVAPPPNPRVAPPRTSTTPDLEPTGHREREPRRPSASDRLQTFLNDAVREVHRRGRAAPLPPDLELGPGPEPRAAPLLVSPDLSPPEGSASFAARLDTALRRLDFRPSIRKNVSAWAARDSAAPPLAALPVLELAPSASAFPSWLTPMTDVSWSPTSTSAESAPAARVSLHARLAAMGRERVEPGDVTTFVVDFQVDSPLAEVGPAGATAAMGVPFEEGVIERQVFVSVSSEDFVPLRGKPWEKVLVLRRDGVSPSSWSFEAKAAGDKPAYKLSVSIITGGSRSATLEVRLARRGVEVASVTEAAAAITSTGEGASFVMKIDREGEAVVAKWASRTSELARWQIPFDPTEHFRALGSARLQDRRALRQYCMKLVLDLDGDLFRCLADTASAGGEILVASPTPMLPFELLPLGLNTPLLGALCPVVRWVSRGDVPLSGAAARRLARLACIRPVYEGGKHLPSAALEEEELGTWAAARGLGAPLHVGTPAELATLLAAPDIDVLHFAGHAEDQPPSLHLPGRDRITPEMFVFQPILQNHPLLFLNACRAGMSHGDQPPSLGGMIEGLLRLGFSGVVAPFLSVDSGAARRAAGAFYEALGKGSSVARAVQSIRELAEDDPAQAATYMSYLAYVPPTLQIDCPAPDG